MMSFVERASRFKDELVALIAHKLEGGYSFDLKQYNILTDYVPMGDGLPSTSEGYITSVYMDGKDILMDIYDFPLDDLEDGGLLPEFLHKGIYIEQCSIETLAQICDGVNEHVY